MTTIYTKEIERLEKGRGNKPKDLIKKICPVCSNKFLSVKTWRRPRGLRQRYIIRQSNAYTCSKHCSKVYQRVREDLKGRGFIIKKLNDLK